MYLCGENPHAASEKNSMIPGLTTAAGKPLSYLSYSLYLRTVCELLLVNTQHI